MPRTRVSSLDTAPSQLDIGGWNDVTVLGWGSAMCSSVFHAVSEDSTISGPSIFAVADGMGGHAAGARASETVIGALESVGAPPVAPRTVMAAITDANQAVVELGRTDPKLRGLGTTLSGIALTREGQRDLWLVFNCGDSRVYSFRAGHLVQITHDHSEVQEMIDSGAGERSETAVRARRHVLTRALGSSSEAATDYQFRVPVAGERFLICSDGLSGAVTDHEIARLLAVTRRPDEAARSLVMVAAGDSAQDDICAVVVDTIRVQGDPLLVDTIIPRGREKVATTCKAT